METDAITVWGDIQPGQPLLEPVMQNGKRMRASEALSTVRERSTLQRQHLPGYLRSLETHSPYPVRVSPALEELATRVDQARVQSSGLSK
jgi:nicotinate phosphoribosyltransferase